MNSSADASRYRTLKEKLASRSAALVFAGTAVLSLAGLWIYRRCYVDDAYITLRFCRNWLAGHGVVWNIGERVEGYSNFLYLALTTAVGWFGVDIVAASRIVSLAAYIALFLFVVWWIGRATRRTRVSLTETVILSLFALTLHPLLIWTVAGLEGALFVLWLTVAVWLFAGALAGEGRGTLIGVAFALATMTHPDGILFFAIAALFGVVCMRRDGPLRARDVRLMVASFVFVFGVYFCWRFMYYGDLFPNTYYAKSSFATFKLERGLQYVLAYLFTPPFLLSLVVLEALHLSTTRRWDRIQVYLICGIVASIVYVIRMGGDHMAGFRYLLGVIPLGALFLARSLGRDMSRAGPIGRSVGVTAVVALCILQFVFPGPRLQGARSVDGTALVGRAVGEYIADAWPAGSLVALNTAGSTPYYGGPHQYIDMLGLIDTHIARMPIRGLSGLRGERIPGHEKGDGAYVVSRRPDYIILGPGYGAASWSPMFRSDAELAGNPEFRQHYRKREVSLDVTGYSGYESVPVARSGSLTFTYYERIAEQ